MTRAGLGLGCAPPPELRIALLGMRCEASGYGLQAIDVTMADAEGADALRRREAPSPGRRGCMRITEVMMLTGRISELLATVG